MRKSRLQQLIKLCLIGIGVFCFSTARAADTAPTTLYRWIDDNGKVHYSERLPQEATGKATAQISRQGTVVKEINRALTPEERLAQEEATRKREEEMKRVKEEDRKDVAVLSSYSSEKDIDMTRIRAMKSNEEAIESAEHNVADATKRRSELTQQSAQYKGKPLPAKLARDIESSESDLQNQQQLLDAKKREAALIIKRYDEDKRRFVRLTKTTTTAATP